MNLLSIILGFLNQRNIKYGIILIAIALISFFSYRIINKFTTLTEEASNSANVKEAITNMYKSDLINRATSDQLNKDIQLLDKKQDEIVDEFNLKEELIEAQTNAKIEGIKDMMIPLQKSHEDIKKTTQKQKSANIMNKLKKSRCLATEECDK